jgi:hypothetical protein
MSIAHYYGIEFEQMLDYINNYKDDDDDETPLIKYLLEFCDKLKIDLKAHLESMPEERYIREQMEKGDWKMG